jgi:hypothetical protein
MALDPTITFTGVTIAHIDFGQADRGRKACRAIHRQSGEGSIGAFIANIFNAVFRRKS